MHPTCIVKDYTRQDMTTTNQEFSQQKEVAWRWTQPVVTYSVIRGTQDIEGDERLALNLAMSTWDFEIELTLQYVKKEMNPDITVSFVPKEEDDYFKANNGVLAYAYFPSTSKEGIIVFNDDYVWTMHGRNISGTEYERITGRMVEHPENEFRTYNVIHTLIHEIGHSLGLTHDEHDDSSDVMDPFYNGILELSPWDITRIRAKYPIRIWGRWQSYGRLKRWLARRKVRF